MNDKLTRYENKKVELVTRDLKYFYIVSIYFR